MKVVVCARASVCEREREGELLNPVAATDDISDKEQKAAVDKSSRRQQGGKY